MSTNNIFNIKKKITLTGNYPKPAAKGFFLGTQKRVRSSCGKRVISVRAIEVLLYFHTDALKLLILKATNVDPDQMPHWIFRVLTCYL